MWISCRLFLPLLGAGLLGHMVFRAGPGAVWKQIQEVGWGLAVIIMLGGLAQLVKTWAWRQTFTCDISALSWSRSVGAQLASDAVGQFGFAGKLLGEGLRVSMIGATVPLADGISSSAIDGGLHTFTAAVVTVLGIIATLVLAPLPGSWRVYALLVAAVLIAVVGLGAVAVASRWQLMGNAVRAIGRLPWLYKFGSAQEFVKVCNWRGFQNAGLRRLGDGFAIMGRWCGGFIRGDGHEPRPSRHSFLGEVPPKPWEEERKALIHLGMPWGMPTMRSRNRKLCGYSQCLGQTDSRFWEDLLYWANPF